MFLSNIELALNLVCIFIKRGLFIFCFHPSQFCTTISSPPLYKKIRQRHTSYQVGYKLRLFYGILFSFRLSVLFKDFLSFSSHISRRFLFVGGVVFFDEQYAVFIIYEISIPAMPFGKNIPILSGKSCLSA
jgi:hypothetical protein